MGGGGIGNAGYRYVSLLYTFNKLIMLNSFLVKVSGYAYMIQKCNCMVQNN